MIQIFMKGGPLMWLILICSVLAAAIIAEKIIYFRFISSGIRQFVADVLQKVQRNRIKEALEMCEKVIPPKGLFMKALGNCKLISLAPGPIANILQAGILRYDQPRERIKEAIQDASLYEIPKLERNLSALAVLAQISVLLGLLGTVMGLAKCFQSIQLQPVAVAVLSPGILAQGIWEAIITTIAGLIVAIPVYVGYSYLSNRAGGFILEMEKAATELVNALTD